MKGFVCFNNLLLLQTIPITNYTNIITIPIFLNFKKIKLADVSKLFQRTFWLFHSKYIIQNFEKISITAVQDERGPRKSKKIHSSCLQLLSKINSESTIQNLLPIQSIKSI